MSGRGRGRGRGRGGGPAGLPVARDDDGTVLGSNVLSAPPTFPDLQVRRAPRRKERKHNAEIGKLRSQLRIWLAEFPAYRDCKTIAAGQDADHVESFSQQQKRLQKGTTTDKASLQQLLTLETSYFPAVLSGKAARETSRKASSALAAVTDAAILERLEAIEEDIVKRKPDDENDPDGPKGDGEEEELEAEMEEDELDEDDDYAQGEDYQDDEEYDYNDDGGDDGPFF